MEYYIIGFAMVAIILAVVLNRKVNLKMPLISLKIDRSGIVSDIDEISRLVKAKTEKLAEYNSNILKNQMTAVEGILSNIAQSLSGFYSMEKVNYTNEVVKQYIKRCLLENGYCNFNSIKMHEYIINKTQQIRQMYYELLSIDQHPNEFLISPFFDKLISDIFAHSVECYDHWIMKISETEKAYDDKINQIKRRYR